MELDVISLLSGGERLERSGIAVLEKLVSAMKMPCRGGATTKEPVQKVLDWLRTVQDGILRRSLKKFLQFPGQRADLKARSRSSR